MENYDDIYASNAREILYNQAPLTLLEEIEEILGEQDFGERVYNPENDDWVYYHRLGNEARHYVREA